MVRSYLWQYLRNVIWFWRFEVHKGHARQVCCLLHPPTQYNTLFPHSCAVLCCILAIPPSYQFLSHCFSHPSFLFSSKLKVFFLFETQLLPPVTPTPLPTHQHNSISHYFSCQRACLFSNWISCPWLLWRRGVLGGWVINYVPLLATVVITPPHIWWQLHWRKQLRCWREVVIRFTIPLFVGQGVPKG